MGELHSKMLALSGPSTYGIYWHTKGISGDLFSWTRKQFLWA